MNVLIVDDEKLARERLLRMISALDDYTVVGQAESGEQAVNMVLEFEPDIVLLDVRMPGMGGIEAGRRISKSTEPQRSYFVLHLASTRLTHLA